VKNDILNEMRNGGVVLFNLFLLRWNFGTLQLICFTLTYLVHLKSEDTTNNSQLFITTIVFGTMSQTDYMLIVYCFNRHIERVLRWNTSLKFIKRSL
jgi:uncharacterized membrane protein